ncbi:TrbG/VirB9 family P-type conjugative transfer protein [Novosphingobium rosa]|uniref:TrbG/VirB9 family P-type conjugative transfer protein n=1 Tax=Novosphingobium rosa TaxID=76978 RepID=UPI0008373525|nr:TrbG/VirB9 family P-type conjugative transfer protein [Novosphingobium rosa]
MIPRHLGPLLALLIASSAQAADRRVLELPWQAGVVVPITTMPGFEATIALSPEERIENIAIGDSALWQVTPNRRANLVFLKPVSARAPVTNMTVVTDRHTYLFELHASARGTPLYHVSFAYPPPPVATPASPDKPAAPEEPAAMPRLNFAWKRTGDAALLPDRVFDDGASAYLSWPEGRDLPAVLASDGKTEGPVNYAMRDGLIVIDGLPLRLILRAGSATATLERCSDAAACP